MLDLCHSLSCISSLRASVVDGKVLWVRRYFRSAAFCVELFAVQMVEHAMTQELMRNGDSEVRFFLLRIEPNIAPR